MPRFSTKGRNHFEKSGFKRLADAGVDFGYEVEKIPYVIEGKYLPDYSVITKKNQKKVIIEYKGYFRREAKAKMAAVKKQNPDLDIRIVFYREKKADVKWALKHGFKIAFGTIPDHWIEEFLND